MHGLMINKLITPRSKRSFLFGILLGAVFLSAMQINYVHAYNRERYNDAEQDAWDACSIPSNNGDRRGAIWFNNTADDVSINGDEAGYYSGSVIVDYHSTTIVPVTIRGSVFSCRSRVDAKTSAIEVAPRGDNSWRLRDLVSTQLYRGLAPGFVNGTDGNWSSKGESINANLDISGIPMTDNGKGYTVGSIKVGLYRCFYNDTTSKQGECDTQLVNVTIFRQKPPDIPPPPLTSSDCNPIKVVLAQPTTYPAQSHTDPRGRSYYAGPKLVPVRVSINGTTIGTSYSVATEINLTTNYTTGDVYTVNFQETTDHVTGYTDNYNTRGSEKLDYSKVVDHYYNGSEIMDTSYQITGYTSRGGAIGNRGPRSFSPKKYVQIPVYKPIPRSYSPKQYNWLYSDTTTNRLGPATLPSKNIGPCYNYALTANIGTSFGAKVEAGGVASVSPIVSSAKYDASLPKTKSMNSEWQITRMVVNPGNRLSPVAGGNSFNDPCDYFGSGGISNCSVQASNSSTVFNTAGNPSMNTSSSYNAPDSLAGTKICFTFSVRARAGWNKSDQDTRWNHASFDPVNNCIIIVKKPKVQIWGGDLWAGGLVLTSASDKKDASNTVRTFGSWDEYGIFATGSISGMASGSAFAGSGLANSKVCDYSVLSFTNVPVGRTSCNGVTGSIGNYSNSHSIPDVAASFPVGVSTLDVTPNLNNLQGIYTGSGNVTISGGNIQKGQWIVVNASNANITITGDINYTNGSLSGGIADIPQVVIIADNINIADNVTNIDAWLIAKNNINTCSSVALGVKLTVDVCNQPLVVNGPVMANKLYLRRTAGSGVGAASGNPAETFKLRADAYLWAALRANNTKRVQTVYTTELPPRF